MNTNTYTHRYSFVLSAAQTAVETERVRACIEHCLRDVPGKQHLEMNVGKNTFLLFSTDAIDMHSIQQRLAADGVVVDCSEEGGVRTEERTSGESSHVMKVCVDGMTCHSCELTVERKWRKVPGVQQVAVNAATGKASVVFSDQAPSIADLQNALGEGKYIVSTHGTGHRTTRPSFLQLVGLFALVFLIGNILSRLGLFQNSFSVAGKMDFGAIFLVGLIAASSSCIAVAGGLLLSTAAKFNERYGSISAAGRMRPVLLFIFGRVLSYAVLGGVLGFIGKALTPSPLITALITIAAALYMLVMGLDMLQIAPIWLKRFTPHMPKSLSHRVMDAEGKTHPLAPFTLGAATFFLPCGFTQALQLYALTTGSFFGGATALLAFALGTAPALFALGWASSSLKGKAGRFFFRFSGALVVVLGLLNIQNGLTIAGYPLSLPRFSLSSTASVTDGSGANAVMDGQTQVIKMVVDNDYLPSQFTVRAGVPTRWEIDGKNVGGCISVLVSRQLGIQHMLKPGANTILFTAPTQPGTYQFSCSMGMYRGQIIVVPNT